MMMSKPNHQYQQQQQQKIASSGDTHKNFTFLPMLCSSSSTKQVKASHRRCASSSSSSTTSSTVSDDPSSPKVGCMGQVKKNNKVVGFPNIISFTSSTTTSSSSNSSNNSISVNTHHHIIKCHEPNNYTSNNIIKYYKLKRFFSTKSPTSVIPVTKTATAGSRKGKIGRKNAGNIIVCKSKGNEEKSCKKKSEENNNDKGSLVNLVEMDPPLPVVKKALQKEQGNNEGEKMGTLWKRRSGGAPLQSLRVQLIQPNIISPVTANTV